MPVHRLGLLLTDNFALMSYACVLEPFRAANVLAGRELYRWTHVSPDGRPARASNGAAIVADQAVAEPLECETLFVFAGGDPARFSDAATFAGLRRLAQRGARLAGVSGGPFLLARAGLLDGYRATLHWEHEAAFAESFDKVILEPGLYVIDRRRMTCAGGTAGMDLAIELIEREHGHALAARVGEWFIRTEPRAADRPQRPSLRERYGVANDRVLKALAHMEATIEDPASRQTLAAVAGVSSRQLERLFAAHLGASIDAVYLRLRLAEADRLLRQTAMSVMAVSVACGFQSASHFSRVYAAHFGAPPSRRRRGEAAILSQGSK